MDLNLRVLQRYDAGAKRIVATGGHVSAHSFRGNEWTSLNYEGPLFVYERMNGGHGYVLMNRRTWANMIGRITRTQTLAMQGEDFLIYNERRTGGECVNNFAI